MEPAIQQFLLPLTPENANPREEESNHDTTGCIAIDANPYSIHAAFTTVEGRLITGVEAKPNQIPRIITFIRRQKRYAPDLYIAGLRTDRWPAGLLPALALEFGPINWVPDYLLKLTLSEFRRVTADLKFLRAMLLATCANQDFQEPPNQARQQILTHWRTAVWDDLSAWLAVGLDDIPF
jgi:hypothetical protein